MNSLATKLSFAFIVVVALGIASVSILVRMETTRGFENYLEAQGSNYLARAAVSLTDLYGRTGDWREAQAVLPGLLRSSSDWLVLADGSGRIVADTSRQLLGQSASGLDVLNETPVIAGDSRVATLYLLSFTPGPGATQGRGLGQGGWQGQGRGFGAPAGAEKARGGTGGGQQAASLESSYLASVDRAILTAALLSALAAIAVGIVVSRRITRPLADLVDASREVASGRLERRVKVVSRDELGRVASTFNTMAENLERNEMARRHMVADIAHDLRTPLAVIQGTVDGIMDGVIEPDRESLESIKEEVAILTKLVADLRTISLAEAGQLRLEKVRLDLLEFARRAVAKVDPIAAVKGISCRIEGESPGPMVDADMDRMGQVLGNLLDNAIRHTPKGGSVVVSVGSSEAGRALLVVSDTGAGIAGEDLPHVFDRFYRADQSRNRKSGGSGLGLAIVKQLVEAHGGRAWVESKPDSGARFHVEMPGSP